MNLPAPKRKRPRPYLDENPAALGARSRPISPTPKAEANQALKVEAPTTEKTLVVSALENGDLANSNDPASDSAPPVAAANCAVQDAKPPVVLVANGITEDGREESGGRDSAVVRAKVEEVSSSPKMDSQNQTRVESTSTSTKPSVSPDSLNFDFDRLENPIWGSKFFFLSARNRAEIQL